MRALIKINYVGLSIPFFIYLIGHIIGEDLFCFALLSTMITGLIQILIGFELLKKYSRNIYLQIYFIIVILFFSLWFTTYYNWLWILPGLLVIYMTIMLQFLSKKMSFLKAQWSNLALINYEINAEILKKYIPRGTEIDLWNGKCYVSLVGFLFQNTRLMGIKVPFHINFEEVNLRFYVKRFENGEWKRGVVFIKEIVPKRALTFVANTFYKEKYQTLPMTHSIVRNNNSIEFSYQWKTNSKWNSILVETKNEISQIEVNSETEFITEHYFGYTKYNDKTTFEYEVTHPRWQQFEVINYNIDVDFESVYGKDFAFLEKSKPTSIFLAKGLTITVENKKKLNHENA